jgi:hypothetical protein
MQRKNLILIKKYDFVKSRHPVKTGVQRIFNYLKKLVSGSPLSLGQASPE